jgi:DedD protein
MSSAQHRSSYPFLLPFSRYLLASGLLVSALSGCALWPKAWTWGANSEAALPPAGPIVTLTPARSTQAALTVQPSELKPTQLPGNTAESHPVQAQTSATLSSRTPNPESIAPAPTVSTKPGQKKMVAHESKRQQSKFSSTLTSSALLPGFYINVGLFAIPSNGIHTFKALEKAELPVFTEIVKSKKRLLTRVRVGPFLNNSLAEAAAEKIKGMQLEAVVFQNRMKKMSQAEK